MAKHGKQFRLEWISSQRFSPDASPVVFAVGGALDALRDSIQRQLEWALEGGARVFELLTLAFWVGGIFFTLFSFILSLLLLPNPLAALVAVTEILLITIPIGDKIPDWGLRFVRYSVQRANAWNRVRTVIETPEAFKKGAQRRYLP